MFQQSLKATLEGEACQGKGEFLLQGFAHVSGGQARPGLGTSMSGFDAEALGQGEYASACMGADVLDVGISVDHACRPTSVPWDFHAGSSWVNEDGNLPAIELLEDRIEFLRLQYILRCSPSARVYYNSMRLPASSGRARVAQKPNFFGVFSFQTGAILVAVSCHFPCHAGNKMRFPGDCNGKERIDSLTPGHRVR